MSGSAIGWATVEVFPSRGMAEVGGSALRGAGIPHRVVADDADGTGGLALNLRTSGAELQVPVEQAEAAAALLRVERGDDGEDDGSDGGVPLASTTRTLAVAGWMAGGVVLLAVLVAELVRTIG